MLTTARSVNISFCDRSHFFWRTSAQQRSTRVDFLIVSTMTMTNIYERMEAQISTPPKLSMNQLGLTTKAAQLSEIANPAQLTMEDFLTVLDRSPPTHGGWRCQQNCSGQHPHRMVYQHVSRATLCALHGTNFFFRQVQHRPLLLCSIMQQRCMCKATTGKPFSYGVSFPTRFSRIIVWDVV